MRVGSIYLPNGNPVGTEKYRLQARLDGAAHAPCRANCSRYEEPLVLAGDYNVIPEPRDAAIPDAWVGDALFLPETRATFRG